MAGRTATDLDGVLNKRSDDAIDAPATAEAKEAWSIDSMDKATWASRKLATAYSEIASVEAWAKREHERIDGVVTAALKEPNRTIGYFQMQLSIYLNALVKAGRKAKNLALPGGTINMRAGGKSLDYDEEAVIQFLRDNDEVELIRPKYAIEKAKLKKVIIYDKDGVVVLPSLSMAIPTAVWAERGPTFSFKPVEEGTVSAPEEESDE